MKKNSIKNIAFYKEAKKMNEFKKLKETVETSKMNKDALIKAAEKEVDAFIRKQTFTGEELLQMRDAIKQGYHGSSQMDEPWLNGILESILTYREEQE